VVDDGGIAALSYANSIYILPVAIFSAALSTAVLPRFSHTFAQNSESRLETELKKAVRASLMFFFLISAVLFIGGELIIKIFFQRGRFSTAGTELTFEVLKIYSIGLVFYSTYAIINKLMYSSSMLKQLSFISIVALATKLFLNFTLVDSMKQQGLALATVASYALLFLLGYLLAAKKLRFKNDMFMLEVFASNGINFAISFGISYYVSMNFFAGTLLFEITAIIMFALLFFVNVNLINGEDKNILNEIIFNISSRFRSKGA
jgi:putative peptidoglycan lipid II flippase